MAPWSSSDLMEEDEPQHRFGDLFPLPLPQQIFVSHGGCRQSTQRQIRRRSVVESARGTVTALNHLAGFRDSARWPRAVLNSAQSEALSSVLRVHGQLRWAQRPRSCRTALSELLKTGGGYSASPGGLARYDSGELSVPRDQVQPLDPKPWVCEEIRKFLDDPATHMLLDPISRGKLYDAGEMPGMYMDPSLENEETYGKFLVTLFAAGLIRFDRRACSVCVFFCVAKKKLGSLRLVVDCRRSNILFRRPPWTPLGSLEGLSRVWLNTEQAAFVAQEDVRDYFYRIAIDEKLAPYFGLPEIRVGALQSAFARAGVAPPLHLAQLSPDAVLNPTFCVMPMGFSWAFLIAQELHRAFAARFVPGVLPQHFIVERKPAPTLSSDGDRALMVYADNAHHFGLSADLVNSMRESLSLALNQHGLKTHEVVEASHVAEALGASIDMEAGIVESTEVRF